jgi:hypothetical protein
MRVRVPVIVQGMGDVGAVGVAVLERHGHFGAGNQRQVQAVGVASVGAGQTQPGTFMAGLPGVAVEQEVDLVATFHVDVAVGVVGVDTGYPRSDSARDLRLGRHRGTEAYGFAVGNGLESDFETAVSSGAQAQASDHRARFERVRGLAGDVEDLRQRQGRTAADAA